MGEPVPQGLPSTQMIAMLANQLFSGFQGKPPGAERASAVSNDPPAYGTVMQSKAASTAVSAIPAPPSPAAAQVVAGGGPRAVPSAVSELTLPYDPSPQSPETNTAPAGAQQPPPSASKFPTPPQQSPVAQFLPPELRKFCPTGVAQAVRPIFEGAYGQATPMMKPPADSSETQAGAAQAKNQQPQQQPSATPAEVNQAASASQEQPSQSSGLSFLDEARPLSGEGIPLRQAIEAAHASNAAPDLQKLHPQPPPAAPDSYAAEPTQMPGFLGEIRSIQPRQATLQAPQGQSQQQQAASPGVFNAALLRKDFPILRERVHGRELVWLDNAATTQKPQSVIDRLKYFYEHENSNIHRAAHELAARATDAYEGARAKVRRFINAASTEEIIFVRGATEGINLIAQSWGRQNIQKGDEIVLTVLEHHANIVPWQMLAAETGARLRVAPVDSSGQIILEEYERLLGPRTRLVAFTQVSNALGTITPAPVMIEAAHRHGARVLLDGAQSVWHMRVNMQALDADFFVFSGHKVFAPTGIGVVYGKLDLLNRMLPWQGGGNMIVDVTFERTIYQPPPARFEAGTGNIADAVGLGEAIDYLDRVGMENIAGHEHQLLGYATSCLLEIRGITILGTAKEKAGVLSFLVEGHKTEEVGEYLNKNGIAVRSGHHCAQPILRRFGVESSVRASLALYNTKEDIDALARTLRKLAR